MTFLNIKKQTLTTWPSNAALFARRNCDCTKRARWQLASLQGASVFGVLPKRGQAILYELNTSVFQDRVQHLADWTRPTERRSKRAKAAVRPPEV
jgi:hypothetical protein